MGMSAWVSVVRVDLLAPGEWRVVDVDGAHIAVFNLEGKYFALEDICTHDGGRLTGGLIEGDQIVCPRHGARFCIRSGAALCAPAYEATVTFPVRIENGEVQIRDERWD